MSHRLIRAIAATALAATVYQSAAAQQPAPVSYPPEFEQPMPLHNVLGAFSRKISTKNPEAQAFFDQGIKLIYSFTLSNAARSFREAQKRDSSCAMCYFGEAWSWGAYLNGAMNPGNAPRAHAAI